MFFALMRNSYIIFIQAYQPVLHYSGLATAFRILPMRSGYCHRVPEFSTRSGYCRDRRFRILSRRSGFFRSYRNLSMPSRILQTHSGCCQSSFRICPRRSGYCQSRSGYCRRAPDAVNRVPDTVNGTPDTVNDLPDPAWT